ncbi:MAG TPA: prolyl oligopeptidase family serine peptidase [Verrucomicrobiae bacterium]|jgi:dienelactone hydrolase|nr:prolyl oligopeptidase family serine peptidase [Verrucomicrobiae bacterium]
MSQPRRLNRNKFIPAAVAIALTGIIQLMPFRCAAKGLADYFADQTREIASSCLTNIESLAEWQARRPELRREAAEMLGLDPMPARTDLKPIVTGTINGPDFIVEKVAFQSLPGLYVTGNLYLPKSAQKPAAAVLYLCGHLAVVTNGISYGNKTAYQHHGIWLARNGYVCLIIDTLELGEIQGHHKGTYNLGMWWWNSRGYTPAGVETWNAIRALDYLESRPEVDRARMGVTGRSGGGAYSWFLAAVDDRVKVFAPADGIADLRSYVVDGTVDSHCDCMFLVNTYRWDYPLLAALCAPRPLLMENTDADALFPLSGVLRTHDFVKRVYDLYGAATNFGLVIAPGPHRDTQDLQVPVLRWLNIHLKHKDPLIETAAVKMFSPQDLRVFTSIPADQINTRIEESFVPAAAVPALPSSAAEWRRMRAGWLTELRRKSFAGWPANAGPPSVKLISSRRGGGVDHSVWEFQSQADVPLRLYLTRKLGATGESRIDLRLPDPSKDNIFSFRAADNETAYATLFPRENTEVGMRRRFMLLGQTLDGMRVWDICRAVEALHSIPGLGSTAIWIEANGNLGVDALYASLFENQIAGLDLRGIPSSHREGPDYLNVLRILDIPEAAAMAADNCELRLQPSERNGWEFLRAMAHSPAAHLRLQ